MKPDYLQSLGEKRRRRSIFLGWGSFGLGVYCLAILGLLFILKTPFFEIKTIEVQGAGNIPKKNIISLLESQAIKSSWPNRFLGAQNLLVWPSSFTGDELALIPSLSSARVDKDYSSKKIVISVAERKPYGIWCVEKKNPPSCLWFDDKGVMFKQAFSGEGNLIRVVKDYYQANLGVNDAVLPAQFLPNLFPIVGVLRDSGLSIREIGLYHLDLEEIEAQTWNGPKILFSLRFPPQGALEVLNSLQNKNGFKKLSYIDFRVENRAYYK
jgi:hypothetical protein